MKYLNLLLLSLVVLSSCSKVTETPAPQCTLWYEQPAARWVEALPVGNGRLGAMVFGDPTTERIQFNEESLWAGCKVDNNNPKSLAHLEQIQQLIFNDQYDEAGKMGEECMVGTPPRVRSYQTFGDLMLRYQWASEATNYKRTLDLNTGLATTTYQVGGNCVTQEVLASAPHDLIAIRVSGSEPFDLNVALVREKDATVTLADAATLVMQGQIVDTVRPIAGPAGDHMKFSAIAKIINEGGTLKGEQGEMLCEDVHSVTIYLTAATNYDFANLDLSDQIDPRAECEKILSEVNNMPFADLKQGHVADHRAMFERVAFTLGEDTLTDLPTDQRLARVKQGAEDNGLMALYFQYGRYLLMGSSREPGRLPANLQGVWNDKYKAPWNSDFHTNINLQMNYWPAEVCNLPEASVVLAGFVDKLTVPGAVTASKMYGAKGWTMHHLTDPFGRTGVADGVWGVTPLNGPWMTFPLYRHYDYTGDVDYLRSIYPIIKGSAEFVLDFLVESPEGYLATNPSYSPENKFYVPGSDQTKISSLTHSSTIDVQIINELFDMISASTQILDKDHAFAAKVEAVRKRLPPVVIGANGTIQEWIQDFEEVQVGHRHMSHLLGLYPLSQITTETPELFEAAQKTIQRRLSSGGGHTGWSRAWIINFYARLHNGDKAYENIQALLAKSTSPNLFDQHPPFQIDGNFGGSSGMAEMLMQSYKGTIRLLPALPTAWDEGSITGLKARGGFECDVYWAGGVLTKAVIYSAQGGSTQLVYGSESIAIDLEPGGSYVYQKED